MLFWYTGQSTLSRIAATNGLSHVISAVGTITSAILTIIFLRKLFFVKTHTDAATRLLCYLAVLNAVIIALVPASAGTTLTVHIAFANALSLILVIILLTYVLSTVTPTNMRICALISLTSMLLGAVLLSGIARQIIGANAFNLFILFTTYTVKSAEFKAN